MLNDDQLVKMYTVEKMTTVEIAKVMGMANSTIYYHLKKCGIDFSLHKGRHSYIDVTGQTINDLYFIRNTERKSGSNYVWEVKCYCGTIFFTTSNNVKLGVTQSCGCLCRKRASERMSQLTGSKNTHWNPDREAVAKNRDWTKTNIWRKLIFERDDYICQCCNKKLEDGIIGHHLDGYAWCVEGRYDVDNGITLCVICHKAFHKQYGIGKNTKQQFEEFIKDKV